LGLSAGILVAFYSSAQVSFHQFGLEALPTIFIQNELILCLTVLFSFFWLIQDLILFTNSFVQTYFIYSAFCSFGFSNYVFVPLLFVFIETILLVITLLKSREHKPLIRYLPHLITLMALSALLEVIIFEYVF
jgi:hypothetical protein